MFNHNDSKDKERNRKLKFLGVFVLIFNGLLFLLAYLKPRGLKKLIKGGKKLKGEVEVGVVWDFNGLSYRAKMANPDDYVVLIPSDGSVISGYTTIINKYAKHPNAAKLAREYIFSDAGQINLAKGNARPIRAEHLTLPKEVQDKLLPNEQYKHVTPIKDADAWEKSSKALPQKWQEEVIINMQ